VALSVLRHARKVQLCSNWRAGRAIPLDFSGQLDGAPGAEQVHAVFCPHSFELFLRLRENALRAATQSVDFAVRPALGVGKHF
jgi:hypothetical protein